MMNTSKNLNIEKNRENREFMYSQMDELRRREEEVKKEDDVKLEAWRKDVLIVQSGKGLVEQFSGERKVEKRVAAVDKQKASVGLSIQKRVKVDDGKIGLVAYPDSD